MHRPAVVLLLLLLLPTFGCVSAGPRPQALASGDFTFSLKVDARTRYYLVHVPPGFDAKKPTPVVLALHPAFANAAMMVNMCGLNTQADTAGFVAVYPYGTGFGTILFWNSGGITSSADDVKFMDKLLDDLASLMAVDAKRVFATGLSNGGMMCHRLAAELSERIAAIAPVGGTLAIENPSPKRPVSVMNFHGAADTLVPFDGPNRKTPKNIKFRSVNDTVKTWMTLNGCPGEPKVTTMPDIANDGTTVTQSVYGPGKDGAEVVLFAINGGGHTWPGRKPAMWGLGKSTMDISASDLIWGFFAKHPMK